MKYSLIFFATLITTSVVAQTNTFPSSGNVGIGTTSPSARLEVGQTYSGSGYVHLTQPSTVQTFNNENIFSRADYDAVSIGRRSAGTNGNFISALKFLTANSGTTTFGTRLIYANSDASGLDRGLHIYEGSGSMKYIATFVNGKMGIGTTTPDEKLTVAGTGKFKEVIVEENSGADFVFEEEYELTNLSELEAYIKANKHLPDIPTAKQMKAEGVKVGELQIQLLKKIEELTLYVIELKKENSAVREELNQIKETNNQ